MDLGTSCSVLGSENEDLSGYSSFSMSSRKMASGDCHSQSTVVAASTLSESEGDSGPLFDCWQRCWHRVFRCPYDTVLSGLVKQMVQISKEDGLDGSEECFGEYEA